MRRKTRWLTGLIALVAAMIWTASLDVPVLSPLAALALGCAFLLLLFWLARLLWRRLLWRVGRRLAFSYFLIGVVPIPMVALLALTTGYLLAGFFLGHLYRDAIDEIHDELAAAALAELHAGALPGVAPTSSRMAFGYYRGGTRTAGDPRTPESWPAWLTLPNPGTAPHTDHLHPFVTLADGTISLAAAAGEDGRGVVVVFAGDLESELRERTRTLLQLFRADDPRRERVTFVQVGGRKLALQALRLPGTDEERREYFRLFPPAGPRIRWIEQPLLAWVELSAPLLAVDDGGKVDDYVAASLVASPATLRRRLLSSSAEVDTAAWVGTLTLAGLLFDLYVAASLVALVMIVGLSRAVNRLSRATDAVRRGDFSVRIPVRRRDQLGELQRNFNLMSEHLEESIASMAEKEAMEKELELAHRLQQDLLPRDLVRPGGVGFASSFEPSAAIGGDYFDILRLDDRRLAVVIADVSGHGLPAGLRMAMLKAALLILVEEKKDPAEILARLSQMVRSEREGRTIVTATLTLFDWTTGRFELTNAGHPPTYLLRRGRVEELLVPGSPLGALEPRFGSLVERLAPGDLAIWLSDGLIEATDAAGEPFGYERIERALAGAGESPEQVRDRLLAAVRAHDGGREPEDDRTLLVMRYGEPGSAAEIPSRM